MENEMYLEEHMRAATCFGEIDLLKELILKGVNINSKNHVNGWTPLHWAASRDNFEAVSILLNNGADPNIRAVSGELPCDLTTSDRILALLGGKRLPAKKPSLPIIPNYLRNPPFFYSIKLNNKKESPVSQSEVSSDEVLLLKVRVADSSETDFIEIELKKSKLTFDKLKEICCEELDIEPHYVLKIRKLPNTIVRNDKDVKRLTDFQELEIILMKIEKISEIY